MLCQEITLLKNYNTDILKIFTQYPTTRLDNDLKTNAVSIFQNYPNSTFTQLHTASAKPILNVDFQFLSFLSHLWELQ